MSVMVIDAETLVKIKNTLVEIEVNRLGCNVPNIVYEQWKQSIETKYRNMLRNFHEINVLNYYIRYYNHNDVISEFYDIDFDMTDEILEWHDAIAELGSLRYNTSDYFATREIDDLIRRIKGLLMGGLV